MINESTIKDEFDYFHKKKELFSLIAGAKAKLEQIAELIEYLVDKTEDETIKKIVSKYKTDQKKTSVNLILLNEEFEDLSNNYDKFVRKSKEKQLPEKILKRAHEISKSIDENKKIEEFALSSEAKHKFVLMEIKRLEKQQVVSNQTQCYIDFLKDLSVKLEKKNKQDNHALYKSEKIVFGGIDELFSLYDKFEKEKEEQEKE